MNGTSWVISIGALTVGTLLSVGVAQKMGARLPKYKPTVVRAVPETKAVASKPSEPAAKKATVDWDCIWKQSLFQADRSEDTGDIASVGGTAMGGNNQNSEFELVGIASVGSGEAINPVAIIAQVRGLKLKSFATTTTANRNNQNNNRNNRNNRNNNRNNQQGNNMRRNAMGMPNMPMAQAQAETKPEDRRVTRNIYHVGEEIGKTGYKVAAIAPSENKVVLERGGSKVELVLDVKNNNNSVRRQNVVNEELALRQKRAAEEKKRLEALQKQAQQTAKQKQVANQRAQQQANQARWRQQFQQQQRMREQQAQATQQAQQDLNRILQNMTQPRQQNQTRQNMKTGSRLNDGSMNTGGR